MKKLVTGVIFTACALQLSFGGNSASAAYDPSGDINVNLNTFFDVPLLSEETAQSSFELQEGVHNSVTNSTGLEVNHSYVWISLNGKKVLGVDPPKPCFNRK
ncbi:hypothetical protein LCL95_14195 [Bacillus timonensis]|nr:hypothetical protein [Bacillus timonensis]